MDGATPGARQSARCFCATAKILETLFSNNAGLRPNSSRI
jgi:hypothetical protein